MNETEIKNVIEAALLAAGRPFTSELAQLFDEQRVRRRREIARVLEELSADYQGRGIEIREIANGYRIQVRTRLATRCRALWPEARRSIRARCSRRWRSIAYRQPITRAEIEKVRGVVVSTNIVRTLLERGWVRVVGHRDVPGKPAMFGTTREFLDYFGLEASRSCRRSPSSSRWAMSICSCRCPSPATTVTARHGPSEFGRSRRGAGVEEGPKNSKPLAMTTPMTKSCPRPA